MIKVPLLPVAPVDFVDDLRPPRARARVGGAFHFRPSKNTGPGNRGIEAGSRPASLDLSIRAEAFWNLLEEAPRSCSDSSAVLLPRRRGGQWPVANREDARARAHFAATTTHPTDQTQQPRPMSQRHHHCSFYSAHISTS